MTQMDYQTSIDITTQSTWGTRLSWLIIMSMTLVLLGLTMTEGQSAKLDVPPEISAVELSILELQGKALIYQQALLKPSAGKASTKDHVQDSAVSKPGVVPDQMDEGTINQRWCYAILLNELESPTRALESLSSTKARLESARLKLDDEQTRIHQLLESSFRECENGEFSQSNLEPSDVNLLRGQLGWFADLLISADASQPELKSSIAKQAVLTFKLSFALFAAGGSAVALGLLFIGVAVFRFYFGKLKTGFTHQRTRQHLYLQTFAIWMLVFFGGQILFELALWSMNMLDPTSRLGWGLIPFLGSLVALVWPLVRGVGLQDLLQDIGWKTRNPFIEIGSGMVSYLMLLPFMLLGLFIFIGLTTLMDQQSSADFSAGNHPSHPIQDFVAEGDALTFVLVILIACVAAPIVEETMFRGVFYRYLRDANFHRAQWLSVAVACIVNSLIFAAIHPQGLMALPLLSTLAIGFSLAREQRDSLIAPMTMHGINNGLVSMMLFILL